mgnify:CR=1 FL=1
MSHIPSYMTGDCCSGYPECQHRPPKVNNKIGNFEHGFIPHEQEERATAQIKSDLQILKDFILGFTARNTDKEWKAFQRIRTALLGEYL